MVVVYGLKFWNKDNFKIIVNAKFQKNPFFTMDFQRAGEQAAQAQAPIIGWSSRLTELQRSELLSHPQSFLVEDGFIRSVGLGAALAPGMSFVIDSKGIYYDGSQRSDLEDMLNSLDLTNAEVEKGQSLLNKLVEQKVSKYNLKSFSKVSSHNSPESKKRVLVVGQVADDASIKSSKSTTIDCKHSDNVNLDLLKYVRKVFPEDTIAFKPHPDVSSGLRVGTVSDELVEKYADHHFKDLNILDAIDWCDHVETISSLSGYEALLRGKTVSTHGTPFYAGWGLTNDHSDFPRRNRQRSIEEMTYILLERYSYCVHPEDKRLCTAEELIDLLVDQRNKPATYFKNWLLHKVSYVGAKLGL